MQRPRDLREWQLYVERGLRDANRGTAIAISHANDKADEVKAGVDAYKDLTPAAPVEITYQTALYINAAKRQRGNATLDFPDVVFATDGTPITVDSYEIYGQDQGLVPLQPFRLMNTSALSSVYATDLNPGSTWVFRVRARANNIIKPGMFSADQTVTITADTTPPPQTTAPVATAVSGGVKLEWDGLAVGGVAMPGDFDHTDVAFGMAANPTTIVDTFPGKSFTIIPKSAYNAVHYFRIRAVDTSGNAGPWSVQATAIPVPLVDVDIIQSVLDGAKLTIGTVAGAALVDQAVTAVKLKDNAVDQTKLATAINDAIAQGTSAYGSIPAMNSAITTADGKAVLAQQAADSAKAQLASYIASGVSLIMNGDFERLVGQAPEGWPTRSLTYGEASTGTARSGTNVLRATPSASSAYAYTDYVQSGAGRIYLIEYWVRLREALIAGNENFLMGAFFNTLSSTGTSTTYTNYTDTAGLSVKLSTLSTTTWTKVSILKALPTGIDIAKIRFGPRIPGLVPTGNNFEIDDFVALDITDAKTALDAAAAAQADATTAITNAAAALTSASGKNTITNSVVDAALAIPGKTSGDRWQKWTTLASGGKLLATWRWNGSAWIAEAMDPTYIPLLDIGAGTFGTLDGVRMTLGTLETKHLAVGDFTNLIPNAQLQSGLVGWTPSNATPAVVTTAGGLPGLKVTKTSLSEATVYAQWVDVIPGKNIRLSYAVEGSWDTGNGAIYAQKKTADGTISSFSPGVTNAGSPGRPDHSYVVTIPSDAVQVRFRPYISNGAAIGSWATFSNMMARWMNNGELNVDGSITSLALATNAVTARTLLVGDFQNLAIGSDFEDPLAVPWTLDPNHTITTTQKKFGTSSLRLAPGAAGTETSTFTGDFRVKEAEQWYLKFHAYIDSSFNGTANSRLRVTNQSGTQLGVLAYNAITKSAWTSVPLELVVTVPAGTTSLTVTLNSDHTAGYAYIDDIQFRRMSEASLIQNLGVEKLVANTASISSAVVDKIWNEVLYSRKITTDMLVVTAGTNMVPDATFTTPESRAKKTANNATGWDTYVSGSGTQAIRYGNATPSWPSVGYLNLLDFDSTPTVSDKSGWIPVLPGEKYEFGGRFYATDAGITTKMYVSFLLGDGTTSGWSSPTITPNTVPDGGPNRSPVWEFTIPATAIKMGARIEHRGTAGWVSLYGDSVYLRKKVDANLIVDGGILAKHLTVTDEMWTDIIHFKKIGGGEIDANNIISDTGTIGILRGGILINDAVTTSIIKADAITSKHTITGAKFQTVTTANRGIKFDVNGLKMWDAGGVQTVDMNAGTGYATITGRMRTAPDGSPGVVLIPPVESDDGKTMAVWFTPDTAILAGGITAGMWISNPATASTPGQVSIRGQQYGGVKLWDAVEYISSNGATVPQFFSNSNVGLQATAYNGTMYLTSGAAEVRIKSVFNTSINVGTGKTFNLQVNSAPYSATNGSAANAIIFSDGNVFKVSSALKYKIDPQPMDVPDSLLDDVTVKHWIDKGMAERFAASFDVMGPLNEQAQREYDALSLQRIPGAIAEDVVAAGGEQFVTRDLEGELDGLMYDRYALARTEILKRRNTELAKEVADLRFAFEGLSDRFEELVASLRA